MSITIENAQPRIAQTPLLPPFDGAEHVVSSHGADAVALYRAATRDELMPWQKYVLGIATTQVDDSWASRAVSIVKPRQQGATEAALVRMLVGLFIRDERQLYTAALHATARNSFLRLVQMIQANDLFADRVDKIRLSHGEECIILKSGATARFRTRGGNGGRGFTADLVVNDDAEQLTDADHFALLACQLGRPDPQTWFVAVPPSRPNQNARVLGRLRRDAIRNPDVLRQLYVEYSADDARDADGNLIVDTSLDDVAAAANPALGYILPMNLFERERLVMPADVYETERLGIGHWPTLDEDDPQSASREITFAHEFTGR